VEIRHLSADVLGLPSWAPGVLAQRPHPASLPGMIVPRELEDFPEPPERHDPETRAQLAQELEARLARFEPHVAVLESVRALRQPGATLVLAGQQPALLGGPLYNVYKALHVIALARALTRRWERPVIPAFWNHADDHDVGEVHHLWIQNPNLDLRKVALAGLSSGRTPLGELMLDEERHQLVALRELLRQNLWTGPATESALELFLPRSGESFSGAFTRVLLGLFGHLGLVVLEPQWLRGSTSRELARVVALDLGSALAAGEERVRASGREPTIPLADAALLFRHAEGRRNALRLGAGEFRYDGEAGSRSGVELAAEIVEEPGAWSPGALLRPVLQDLVLPTAAYVGGWGELAYHAQLGPLRALVGAPATPFVPRLSATLVDAASQEAAGKCALEVGDVLLARGVLTSREEATPGSPVSEDLRAVARDAARELLARRESVAAIDRGLAQQLRRSADQVSGLVEKLAAKLDRVQANAAGSGRRHQRRLSNGLFPNGQPQERQRGALEFVARLGTDWIDALLENVEPLPTEHLVVHLDPEPRDPH